MSALLTQAACDLAKRESSVLVAATGLVFQSLADTAVLASLADVLESHRGGVWGDEAIGGHGYPVLRTTDTRGTKADVTNASWRSIPDEVAAKCALRTGDILVTKSSGSIDLVGKAALFTHPCDGRIYLFSNFILRLRPAVSSIDPRFLAWFLRSPQSLLWRFEAQQNAVGLRNLSTTAYLGQSLPVPDLHLQRLVADYLDSMETGGTFDAKLPPPLAEQKRIVARIEELSAQIEEARSLRRQAADEAEVLWQCAAERVCHETAGSFPCLRLSQCVAIRGGGTPSKANPYFWQGSIPWVSPKDMKSRDIHDSIDHITEEATASSAATIIPPGAVLIVVRGMILAHTVPSAVLKTPAAINQDMKALLPNPCIEPDYLSTLIWAQNRRFLGLVEKSTHDTRKLQTEPLLELDIPVPPLAEQRRIVEYLDGLQTKVDALKRLQAETSAELDALLPAILDRAFKGEL